VTYPCTKTELNVKDGRMAKALVDVVEAERSAVAWAFSCRVFAFSKSAC
jgi:hypothetical protein